MLPLYRIRIQDPTGEELMLHFLGETLSLALSKVKDFIAELGDQWKVKSIEEMAGKNQPPISKLQELKVYYEEEYRLDKRDLLRRVEDLCTQAQKLKEKLENDPEEFLHRHEFCLREETGIPRLVELITKKTATLEADYRTVIQISEATNDTAN